MKKMMFSLLFLITGLAMFAQNGSVKDEKVYEIKSGIIAYQIDGMTKGTKTLWFDDYGRLQCTRTTSTTTLMGFSTKEDKLEIRTHEWVYIINMIDKTGTKAKIEVAMAPTDDMYSGLSDSEKEQFVEQTKASLNVHESGTGVVLGRTCKIMEIGQGNKVWTYKNISLKSEVQMGTIKMTETPTSFDENASVPASKFEPPAGIQIEDVTEMMKQMDGFGFGEDEE
jgi:hypothetical protein